MSETTVPSTSPMPSWPGTKRLSGRRPTYMRLLMVSMWSACVASVPADAHRQQSSVCATDYSLWRCLWNMAVQRQPTPNAKSGQPTTTWSEGCVPSFVLLCILNWHNTTDVRSFVLLCILNWHNTTDVRSFVLLCILNWHNTTDVRSFVLLCMLNWHNTTLSFFCFALYA